MSTPPENDETNPPEGPWATHPATGEHERISPPAPIIEVDGLDTAQPVKPLGPRRLARLQREMAEHTRRIQEAERQSGVGEVDEALLAQQRRLAELAVRAAAASEQDRVDADRAMAAGDAATEQPPSPGALDEPGAARPPHEEYVTITFPGPGPGQEDEHDAGSADPASLPASPLHYGPVTTTQLTPVVGEDAGARTQGETATVSDPASGHAAASLPTADGATTDSDGPAASPVDAPEGEPGGQGHGAPSGAPDGGEDAEPAPASPVRAVDAEGLELLEPRAYTRSATGTRVLLALLLVVVAALVVALIMFVL